MKRTFSEKIPESLRAIKKECKVANAVKGILTARRHQRCLSISRGLNELETREIQGHKVPLN